MGFSRKYINNTSSPVSVTINSTDEFTGYLGSVSISAYDALVTDNDIPELEYILSPGTFDKYLNGEKVYHPGALGYLGSFGATGYTGSVGYKGSAA